MLGEVASRVRPSLRWPRGDQGRYSICVQAADRERERVGGAAVEPVRIVDEKQQRLVLGGGRQERERRSADCEPRRLLFAAEAKCRAKHVGLLRLQPVEHAQNRPAEIEKPDERQFRLGLHAASANDPEIRCLCARVLEQRRLADPWITDEHKRRAPSGARMDEQPVD